MNTGGAKSVPSVTWSAAGRRHLLRLLLTFFLNGLGSLLRDVLATLDRLFLDLVGRRADALVLDSRRRDHEAGDEADGGRTDGEPERVLLRHAHRLLSALLHVGAARR